MAAQWPITTDGFTDTDTARKVLTAACQSGEGILRVKASGGTGYPNAAEVQALALLAADSSTTLTTEEAALYNKYLGTEFTTLSTYADVDTALQAAFETTAEFSGTPVTGEAPLEVTFTNLSTGADRDYLWAFGDGETSTEENPVHTYETADTWTVVLTVSNSLDSDAESKTDYIETTAP
jgi:PKD repeat protein